MILIALSISSRILRRPSSRCSLSFFLLRSKNTRRRTHSVRHAVHSSSSSRYAEHARHACNQHVEVAGEAVLQGSHLHQLGHQLFRVGAALEVNGDLQTGKVGLIAHIGNLAHLTVLDQLGDLVDDGLDGGRVRNLRDLDQVVLLVVRPFCAYLERAASGVGRWRVFPPHRR